MYHRNYYNEMAFTPDEMKKGLHLELLHTLLEISNKLKDSYYDIHILSDGYCLIIQWCDVFFDKTMGDGKFEFVSEDEVVMYEGEFPDNHYERFFSEEEYKEALNKWLKENPGWVKSEYGRWINEKENEEIRKVLLGEKNDAER